jgi:AcrR family transcriptional regulator
VSDSKGSVAGSVAVPRRTQEERSEETRGRLLDATIASLIDLGYARTTTTEVAKRAGLSRGAQLHHFPTKAELVVAAIGHLARSRTDELVAQVDALPQDPEDWVDAAIDLLWSTFRGPLFYAALELWVAARTDEELAKHLLPAERQLGREIMSRVVGLLPAVPDDGQWANFLRNLDELDYVLVEDFGGILL